MLCIGWVGRMGTCWYWRKGGSLEDCACSVAVRGLDLQHYRCGCSHTNGFFTGGIQ